MRRMIRIGAFMILAGCRAGSTPNVQSPTPTPQAPPAQSFTVSGTVYDTIGRPVSQAVVDVLDGLQKGTVVFTDSGGKFSLDQPFTAGFMLRASKDGYQAQTRYIPTVTTSALYFQLPSASPAPDISGLYTATFAADAACKALPDTARSRTYTATVGASLAVLSGAAFGPPLGGYSWDVLYLAQFGNTVKVFFSDPEVWELLEGDAYVTVSGEATGLASGPTFELPVTGRFTFCPERETDDHYPECEADEVVCQSANHRLTLTRR